MALGNYAKHGRLHAYKGVSVMYAWIKKLFGRTHQKEMEYIDVEEVIAMLNSIVITVLSEE